MVKFKSLKKNRVDNEQKFDWVVEKGRQMLPSSSTNKVVSTFPSSANRVVIESKKAIFKIHDFLKSQYKNFMLIIKNGKAFLILKNFNRWLTKLYGKM